MINSEKFKQSLLLIIFAVLVSPFLQSEFHFTEIEPLKGAIVKPEREDISKAGWFSGDYQKHLEKYLNETFGFRDFLVRLNNQLSFDLFKKAKANSVIVGKDNYFFEENYIKAYNGLDFIGEDSIAHRIERLKYLQDELSKMNKDLVIVFAAGKGTFFNEYFPRRYMDGNRDKTNYKTHIKLADKAGLKYIDFNSYFLANKNKSAYPLYPQYGIHWSYYGMCLVGDSLIHYIEKKRNIDMPDIYWDKIDTGTPRETDYDIADGMNLLTQLNTYSMAYPEIHFQPDSGKTKPSVIVISDSYYWGIFNYGISNAFDKSHFWYYNKQIYPDSYQQPLETNQINLTEEINKHDVIILMATEATLPDLGWGFIENAYNQFKSGNENLTHQQVDTQFEKKVTDLMNYIRTDKKWLDDIKRKAAEKKLSLDSMLRLDAIWQLEHEGR